MTTIKKMFSFDSVTDSDIVKIFESLPNGRHSEYIRNGLRLLMNNENVVIPVAKEEKRQIETVEAPEHLFDIG